jgi:hypothetical protein
MAENAPSELRDFQKRELELGFGFPVNFEGKRWPLRWQAE